MTNKGATLNNQCSVESQRSVLENMVRRTFTAREANSMPGIKASKDRLTLLFGTEMDMALS